MTMTPEAIKACCKAFALVVVTVGGFGSVACVPYALTTNLYLIATSGIYFIAGAVMITGGLLSYVLLNKAE
jgi:hypothetical protein